MTNEITSYEAVPISQSWLQAQQEESETLESVAKQLLVLQTAYPTITRNYDKEEYQAMLRLWYAIFKNVPQRTMREAIRRYIITDRKGFFPAPGQIIGYIEQIVAEENAKKQQREFELDFKREYARMIGSDEGNETTISEI